MTVNDPDCKHYEKILVGVQDGIIYYRCSECKGVIKIKQKRETEHERQD